MGIAGITMKIMPSSLEVDFEEIKKKIKSRVVGGGGKNCRFEEQPIAFGLKAIIVSFEINEDQELASIEENLGKLNGVKSVSVIDMRRAFG